MQSKITGGSTTHLFTTQVLAKYDVAYYQCNDTGFIQTEEPYWLQEAYSSAITKLDVGLVLRNQQLAIIAERLLIQHFNHNGIFLDYAGGYGLFTRMMRDKGFDFYNTDVYCDNILAEYHDLKMLPAGIIFELTTAFEVFEHLPQPLAEIEQMLTYSDHLLFSTELVPGKLQSPSDWWYFIPATGQHVAFYTEAALEHIAKKFDRYFYTNGTNVHLFTKKQFAQNPLAVTPPKRAPFFIRKMRKLVKKYDNKIDPPLLKKISLIEKDFNEATKRIS